jgi:hypothetical protein
MTLTLFSSPSSFWLYTKLSAAVSQPRSFCLAGSNTIRSLIFGGLIASLPSSRKWPSMISLASSSIARVPKALDKSSIFLPIVVFAGIPSSDIFTILLTLTDHGSKLSESNLVGQLSQSFSLSQRRTTGILLRKGNKSKVELKERR